MRPPATQLHPCRAFFRPGAGERAVPGTAATRYRAAGVLLALVLLGAGALWPGTAAGTAGYAAPTGPAVAAAAQPDQVAAARVGLQIGHLRIEELPEDQERLRTQTGGVAGGYREVDINYAVVERVAALLLAQGVAVDILPATVPKDYLADAFVAVHCDATPDGNPAIRGYKLARYRESVIPERDDALVEAIGAAYGAAIGLPLDPNISRAMTGYYAYNQRRFVTTISPQTPSTIVELGFLTNPADRAALVGRQDAIAVALADGILRFLAAAGKLPTAARVVPGAAAASVMAPAQPASDAMKGVGTRPIRSLPNPRP
jgi:hypothetical protein